MTAEHLAIITAALWFAYGVAIVTGARHSKRRRPPVVLLDSRKDVPWT